MLASKIRVAEKVLLWVTCIAVLVAAVTFIVLALSRSSDAAELVLGPQPVRHMGTASVTVALPKPKPVRKPVVRVLSRIVAVPAVTRTPVRPRPPALPQGSVQERIAAAWPGNDAEALAVTQCESGWNPNARSGPYFGLWQMDSAFMAAYGSYPGASVEVQTAAAWRGYQARGWQPWPNCGAARFGPR